MSSIFGKMIKISLFGESHSQAIGLVIDGFPAGIKIDYALIERELEKRKPHGIISTSRQERDEVQFLSGVFNDHTTGAPISFIIKNEDVISNHYKKGEMRPSHADYVANAKYHGFQDYRGGGHFSGRLTAPLVVLGAICQSELEKRGIYIGSHISSIGEIEDDDFNEKDIKNQIKKLSNESFAVLNPFKKEKMIKLMENIRLEGDSIGGSVKTAIYNLPIGLGEPFFDSLESMLSHLIFSLGGVKGILFGDGLAFKTKRGSELNDAMVYVDGKPCYLTNHSGGIQGGISNGEPILFETIIKPTPSIHKKQKSINIDTKETIDLEINGRHDTCIVHRLCAVIDAVSKYCVYELLMQEEAKRGMAPWNMD